MSDEHSAQIISHLFLTAGYTEKKTGNKKKKPAKRDSRSLQAEITMGPSKVFQPTGVFKSGGRAGMEHRGAVFVCDGLLHKPVCQR